MSAVGRPLGGGGPRSAPNEGRSKENRSEASLHDTTDNLQPVANLVAHSTDSSVRPLGRAVLREVGDYLRIQCPPTAKEIVKRCTPWEWLTEDKEWSVPAYWMEKVAADLREAGYDVQQAGSIVAARSRRTTPPECPGVDRDGIPCRAPFRIGTPLPLTCSQCGTYVTAFHSYDPDE